MNDALLSFSSPCNCCCCSLAAVPGRVAPRALPRATRKCAALAGLVPAAEVAAVPGLVAAADGATVDDLDWASMATRLASCAALHAACAWVSTRAREDSPGALVA